MAIGTLLTAPISPAFQIHRLKKTEDLVGACYKAGYDGK